MSRRRGSVSRSVWTKSLLFVIAWSCSGALPAQDSDNTIALSAPVLQTLAKLQDEWLVWNSAFLQDDEVAASAAVDDMLASAEQLGFSSIADVHHGVLLSAVEAAREGNFAKARWALGMAERLDRGQPETEFARGRVETLEGNRLAAVGAQLRGVWATATDRRMGRLFLYNVQIWLLVSLLLTSAGYIALQMATKGPHLYREVVNWLGRLMPRMVALVIAGAFLLWPFLLPRGWAWIVIYWAALLWGYGSSSEKWATALALIFLGLVPIAVRAQQAGLIMALSPEQKAIDGIVEERLYGTLFEDLARLDGRLPDSVAADHLLADVHVMLGQRELARPRYSSVADAEPDNGEALNNLGVFHLMRNEHARAIPFFESATAIQNSKLAAAYNLAQIYSERLEISNSEQQLSIARSVDAGTVSQWIAEQRRFVPLQGGFERIGAIREELRGQLAPAVLMDQWRSWGRSILVSLGAIGVGFLLQLFRSRSGAWRGLQTEPVTWLGRAAQWSIPGFISAEAGDGGRAFVALLVPVTALVLPISGLLSYRMPWSFGPGPTLVWGSALVVLALFFAWRWKYR